MLMGECGVGCTDTCAMCAACYALRAVGCARAGRYLHAESRSMDPAFAIQAVSRFVIPHRLIESGHLAPGAKVMSIANTGQTLSDLSLDDLSLHGERYQKMWHARLFGQQSARDSCVLDAFHEVSEASSCTRSHRAKSQHITGRGGRNFAEHRPSSTGSGVPPALQGV